MDVTISIRSKNILKGFDDDVVDHLTNSMKEKGIKFINETFPNDISFKNKNFYVSFKKRSTQKFDLVMEALGRVPNIENLNLKAAKVKTSKNNSIIVNNHFKTSNKKVFAIGDVIDRVQLTPVAIAKL